MLRELAVLLYAGVVGFVAAGITGSFYRLITAEPPRFGAFGNGVLGTVTTFIFGALTGPVIVLDTAMRYRKVERMPLRWLAVGALIAVLWSCCLGIVVLELMLTLRDSFA